MLHSKKNKDRVLFYVTLSFKAFYFFLVNHNNYKCQIIHILSCCFKKHAVICLIFVQKISRFVLKIIFSEQMLEVISRCLKRKNNKTPLLHSSRFSFCSLNV